MRLETTEDVTQKMKFFVTYFEHFVEENPLFGPELERAQKIVDIVTGGGTVTSRAERVRSSLSAPMREHCDGSGWKGFVAAVMAWLELTEQGRATARAG
jgi:hypothetical protein